jgi:putative membrane protein
MRKFALFAAALLLSGPAFAQSTAEKTGINTLVGNAPKTADFVKEAATSDMFEIASSQLALEKGDAATKTFAQQMITDHGKTTAKLKQFVSSNEVQATLPTAMTSAQQKMLGKLKGLQGAGFVRQYRSDQVTAHKDAIDLFKRYGGKGENAALKQWAAGMHPTLEHHLQMAQGLK